MPIGARPRWRGGFEVGPALRTAADSVWPHRHESYVRLRALVDAMSGVSEYPKR